MMIKTLSFGMTHIAVAFLVVWAMTGSWVIGGAVALVEPLVNTVAYYFHEKVWARISRGKTMAAESGQHDGGMLLPA